MPCINLREGEPRLIIYQLDGCGNPVEGASNKLVLDTISELGYEDSIQDGDQVTERNFGGKKKYSSSGSDEIEHEGVNLTGLGMNPALDVMLMNSTSKTDGGEVVGFGRRDLSSTIGVAIEIQLQLGADACAEGSTAAPIACWLFPLVRNWRPSGGTNLNGSDLVKPGYSGKGYKNPNIFEGGLTDPDLVKWNGIYVPPATTTDPDGEWFTFYIFDGDDYELPDADCEPVALT